MNKRKIKKYVVFLSISLFILASILPNISGNNLNNMEKQYHNSEKKIEKIKFEKSFSKPEIIHKENSLEIKIKEANTYIQIPDEPKIPSYTKTLTIPFGSKIIDIKCIHSKPEIISFNKKIDPIDYFYDEFPDFITKQNNLEKNQWYQADTGGGIKDGVHQSFIKINFNPLKYDETLNEIYFCDNFEITIEYEVQAFFSFENDEYDLLIISPNNFQKSLETLVTHKEGHGIKTKLVTLDEIYQDRYFTVDGRDDAEEIKYFIFNAFNQWGIDFVLLVGNINKIPIRKTWMGSGDSERTPLTDLYYADICFSDGSFCSWDSNENGYYGEFWHGVQDDLVDLYADVYLGRLACNNAFEVKTAVKKIIDYENNAYGSDWSNNFLLIGGDTHPSFNDYAEGEVLIDEIAEITPTMNHIMLKTSDDTFSHESVNDAINDGAGLVCYAGHGFEIGLSTHPPNSEEWVNYNYWNIFGLRNKEKLPIILFDACLTARLDYNILNLIYDIIYFTSPLPKLDKLDNINFPILFPCIAWEFVSQPYGGAVASIGATRVTYGMIEEDGDILGGCSYFTLKFFEAYENSSYLSEMLVSASNDYLNYAYWFDPFVIEEMVLLGDPSLKIGGYE